MENSKPYKIPKQTVMAAYKKVKANKGSAGVDGKDFEKLLILTLIQSKFSN